MQNRRTISDCDLTILTSGRPAVSQQSQNMGGKSQPPCYLLPIYSVSVVSSVSSVFILYVLLLGVVAYVCL